MRSDMFEVIIERPRVGCSGAPKGRRNERLRQQEAPTWEPVSRGRRSKCLNENLAPLERFLVRHVGKPWNAVHSEMCAQLTLSSAVQKHVLDHVEDMVEKHPIILDGVVYRPIAYGGVRFALRSGDLYVCPRTGLLCRIPLRRRAPRAPRPTATP